MAEPDSVNEAKEKKKKLWKAVFAISGIMLTLVIYGLLQVSPFLGSFCFTFEFVSHCSKLIEETIWVFRICYCNCRKRS